MTFKPAKKMLSLLVIVVITISITIAVFARRHGTQTIENKLGISVVETICAEQVAANRGLQSPTVSVYVQYSPNYFRDLGVPLKEVESTPYLSAWICDDSKIHTAENQEVIEAINAEAFWVSFTVRSIHNEEALVDTTTIFRNRTSGEAGHWTFQLEGNKWIVTDRDYYFSWD